MKHVDVEYIESGTFVGGEEDTYEAGIKHGEACVVVTKEDFDAMVANESELAGWQAIAREFARSRNKAEIKAADLRDLVHEMIAWNKLTELEISNLRLINEDRINDVAAQMTGQPKPSEIE